jgi:hypothetical protein
MVVINFIDGTKVEFDKNSNLVKWDIVDGWAIFDCGYEYSHYYNIMSIKSIAVGTDDD